MMFHP